MALYDYSSQYRRYGYDTPVLPLERLLLQKPLTQWFCKQEHWVELTLNTIVNSFPWDTEVPWDYEGSRSEFLAEHTGKVCYSCARRDTDPIDWYSVTTNHDHIYWAGDINGIIVPNIDGSGYCLACNTRLIQYQALIDCPSCQIRLDYRRTLQDLPEIFTVSVLMNGHDSNE